MDLQVQERQKFGKAVSALRRQGFIPAELYGHGIGNIHLAVKKKDFDKAFKEAGESTVINLLIGSESRPALVHDLQKDYVSDEIVHVDFYQVRMDEKIKTHVPLEFIGEAPAVKEKGGILNKTLSEIEVEALPGDLPRHIEVSLDGLTELDQSVYVRDLKIPANVRALIEPDTVIVTVTPPAEEEKVEVPADVTAVKVESEEKAAERAKEREKSEEPK